MNFADPEWKITAARGLTVLVCSVALLSGWASHAAWCQPEVPSQVDLRPEFEKFGFPALNQGKRDTCTTFADTALAEFESARHPYLAQRTGDGVELGTESGALPFSEEFLIWAGNEASGLTGDQAMFWKSVHGLQTFGICPAVLMPYRHNTADPVERPSKEALMAAKAHKSWQVHWIKRWNSSTGLTEREMREIKQALAEGHPVATGMRWPKNEQLSGDNVIQIPPPDQVFDGHTVAEVGYRDDPGQPGGGVFIFRNSNGPNWAENGYAYIPYAYIQQYVNDALWLQPTKDVSDRTVRLEGENLQIVSTSRCNASRQEMSDWGAKLWSGKKQLMCSSERSGSVTMAVPVVARTGLEKGARYRISLLATMAPDFGKIQAYLDGKPIGREFDCYNPRVQPTGAIPLGPVRLSADVHNFSVSNVGKNAASTNYNFGIDAIQFVRMEGS